MVKVIMGLKGSGKTKQLIEAMRDAVHHESGSLVCIDIGHKLTYDVDYRVRLIEASDYDLGSFTFLKGFISGLHAGNFDITRIYIDNLYKISGSMALGETEDFLLWCERFGEANGINFMITISDDIEKATDAIRKYF
jgi:hypothetical protein